MMSTNEIAAAIGAEPRLVRRWLMTAAAKNELSVTLLPGHGRLKFADPTAVAVWLDKHGFRDAAQKLRAAVSTRN